MPCRGSADAHSDVRSAKDARRTTRAMLPWRSPWHDESKPHCGHAGPCRRRIDDDDDDAWASAVVEDVLDRRREQNRQRSTRDRERSSDQHHCQRVHVAAYGRISVIELLFGYGRQDHSSVASIRRRFRRPPGAR